ncbi:MAG: ABC transporter ATP-binding protein [Acidobacteria bacterium]|nr:ABC transporter ATP-binding protein [Acidobacteriota bacterium]
MSPARRLLGYALRYRRAFLLGFFCVVATTAIGLASPWVLKYAIDDLQGGVTAAAIRFYAVALLALGTVGGLFRFLMRRIIIGASRDIEYDLRNDFFAHLQRLDLAYFQQHRTGDLMSRATNDLSAVRSMVGPAVMYTVNTALTFIVAVALMMSIDPWLTLVALIPLPPVSLSVGYFGAAIHRRFERIQEQLSDVSAVTQENLSGVRVIRAYGQEPFEIERFRRANEEYLRRNRALIHIQGIYGPGMGLLMGVGALLVLWLGSREVVLGRMTVGELVAFNAYLMMLAWPMIAFGWVTNLLQRGMASWKRMLEVLDTEPAIKDVPWAGTRPVPPDAGGATLVAAPIRGDVEVRHLTFGFGDRVVLHDVSAVLPAGSTTAIVGATGSGKSTLLSLLPRLHEPPPGTVFIDGVDVREMPLAVLRGAIGFVPQEPFHFGGSIAENITFGARGDGTGCDRLAAAETARLDKDVEGFPRGYDTIIGERGITLSGGQKQRTAVARALTVDPKILVLDDALSAVDTYTEEEILGRLAAVMRQRTSIVVSHRVSTVRGADQILVLADGRIAERGTHDQLVARNGLYAELYRKQLLEEELAAS